MQADRAVPGRPPVAGDTDAATIEQLAAEGMATRGDSSDFVTQPAAPRVVHGAGGRAHRSEGC